MPPRRRKRTPPRSPAPQADGMMAGVSPGVKTADDEKKKMLPVTDVRPLRQGAAELERVPVRELICHIDRARP